MLILARNTDQGITIDQGRIHIKIIEVHGDTCKIGIEAPKHCLILRDELIAIAEANRAAVASVLPQTPALPESVFEATVSGYDKIPGTVSVSKEDAGMRMAR